MTEEFCPECGAKITGTTGFCPECGAVTTSLENQIKETKRIKREEEEKRAEQSRIAREKRIKFIKKNKYYLIGLLILIIAVVSVLCIISSFDTSNKVYECDEYSVEYPHNYTIGSRDHTQGSTGIIFTDFEDQNSGGKITISIHETYETLKESKKSTINYYDSFDISLKDKGTKTIDGVKGYVLEYKGHWTGYFFIKDDMLYIIESNEVGYNDIDTILNTFKFK